jgi:hypothetical protein
MADQHLLIGLAVEGGGGGGGAGGASSAGDRAAAMKPAAQHSAENGPERIP